MNKTDFEIISRRIYEELARDPRRALTMAERGIALARLHRSGPDLARMFLARAHACRETGSYDKALLDYERSARLFAKAGEHSEAARTVIGKLDALDQLGAYNRALRAARKARHIFKRHGLTQMLARLNANTGNIFQHLGRYTQALKYYQLAYSVLSRERPLDGYVVLFNQATVYLCQGNPEQAFEPLNACRLYFEANDLSSFLARTYYNLAYACYLQGRYQDSLAHLSRAGTLFRKLRDTSFLASCFLDEAELYLKLNRNREAIEMARRALLSSTKLKMPYEIAESRAILGIALLKEENLGPAVRNFKAAQKYFRSSRNLVKSAELDTHIALALLKSGQTPGALFHLQKALSLFSRKKLYHQMLSTLTQIAEIQVQRQDDLSAYRILRKADSWIRKVPLPWAMHHYYQLLGVVEFRLGKPSAGKQLEKAIRLVESMRVEIPAEDLRVSFLQDKMLAFETAIENEMARKDSRRAFQYSERARSRVLLDLLQGSLSYEKHSETAKQLFVQMGNFKSESWRKSIAGTASSEADETRILRMLRRLQHANRVNIPETIQIEEVQKKLKSGEVLVSYYWIGKLLCAFLLDSKGLETFHAIAHEEDVARTFQLLKFQLERMRYDPSAATTDCEIHLNELFTLLIQPLYSRLRNSRSWTIIPHRWLHGLPFHCLRNEEGYLIDSYHFDYVPSASIFSNASMRKNTRGHVLLLGFADENAPLIEEEILEITRNIPSALFFVGGEATSNKLIQHSARAKWIHIASHARFQADRPLQSGVLLADGWFSVPQIYQLRLSAELIVLSGCETGGQKILAGDELLGLVRAFLHAGASSLLVSQWRVSDRSTAYFMNEFYQQLSHGESKTASWREALLRTKKLWPHPYHWGPFQLIC